MTAPEDVMATVFGVERARITDATSNRTLPEWDSLAHMTLVLELERVFAVSLSVQDALDITSVDAIRRILRERGARW